MIKLIELYKEIKVNQPGLVDAKTDGIRGKDVKVRKLDLIYKDEYSELYWCEYPKGYLDVLFLDKDKNDWLTDLDVGIEALEGLTEISPDKLYKNALKKYNLKSNKINEIKVNNPSLPIKGKKYLVQFRDGSYKEGIFDKSYGDGKNKRFSFTFDGGNFSVGSSSRFKKINEIKINKPTSLINKIIETHSDLFDIIDTMEDNFESFQYDALVADTIEGYFEDYSKDELFPEGWYDLLDIIPIQSQKSLYKDLQSILQRIKNNLGT